MPDPGDIDQRCTTAVAQFNPTTGKYTCSGCGKVLQRSPDDHAAGARKRIEARKRVAGKPRTPR